MAIPVAAALNVLLNERLAVREAADEAEPARLMAAADAAGLAGIIRSELAEVRARGSRSFGIFGHSNQGVAMLGHDLTEAGIAYALIGIPEAEGEALAALGTLVGFAIGQKNEYELRVALATFLTACTRGRVPDLAVDLVNGADLARGLARRLAALREALRDAGDFMTAVEVAARGWIGLDITHGNRPWRQAAAVFAARARQLARSPGANRHDLLGLLDRAVVQLRRGTLIGDRSARPAAVQLMNFHQTKGREADAVILVYRNGDFLAGATEPFEDASRVLYVSLTRARHSVAVVLPPGPHPLVAPFAACRDQVRVLRSRDSVVSPWPPPPKWRHEPEEPGGIRDQLERALA
jgi:DNA helicase-2/ATP-dependent DNA helicase PcrA